MPVADVVADAPVCELVKVGVTVQAAHVRPTDTIEYADPFTGESVAARVCDVVRGWVWHGGERIDTVLLVTDPVTGRGPVLEATDPVTVVDILPDQVEPADDKERDCTWW